MAERKINKWVTINSRHVPIYEDSQQEQIAATTKKAKQFNDQKKLENLLVEAGNFKYTHQDLSQMWSRAQLFPVINKAVSLYNKLEKYQSKLDPSSPNFRAVSKALEQLRIQNRLLQSHKDRLFSELEGGRMYFNEKAYEDMYAPYGLYDKKGNK